MRKFLIVLLVLVVAGLIGADRFGEARAENEVARQVAAQYRLPEQPSVEIGGFPFLTQAISGNYGQIDVSIGDYTQQGVTVQDVNIRLNDLKAPLGDLLNGDQTNVRAERATASAVIPYAVVQKATADKGVQKVSRSGDNVLLEGTVSFHGLSAQVGVNVSIKTTERGVTLTPESVQASGIQVPLDLVKQNFTSTVPVTGLPMGSRITSVEPVDTGLRITGTARNVDLSGAAQGAAG
ncbi:LmeA family phospholipid-binding protein [Actinocorallia populi]|uniref:LmeA family phospholipid-binding protein n=1 Tax=Actinocorallia populi TaxID=2079200 RepID=UPI000D09546E|nr:DUF2993 domain-containing protein [Actinocorallia populi]